MTPRFLTRAVAVAAGLFILSACSLTPEADTRPPVDVPTRFAEATLQPAEEPGRWRPAEPADHPSPSPWWQVFGDPVLMRLEDEALAANPDVAIAMARLQQARAIASRRDAERLPEVDAGFGPTRQRMSGAAPAQTVWRAQASVAYEADIFGRVAAEATAARADAAGQQALAHQVLLLVQADVAGTYFSLRQLEGERRLLAGTVTLRQDAADLLRRKLAAGAVAGHVVDQADTELLAARAEQRALDQRHALASHALAILLGKAPADFSIAGEPLVPVAPRLPAGLPSALLERRPDIAAAERAMAAANARIGGARAASFPSLSLTGAFGYESAELGHLARWSQRTFLLGPLVGTALSLPIFDGGRRQADVARARARHEEQVAAYRKTVLQAFREVEDALVSVRLIDERITDQRAAQDASARVARSAKARFDEGDVDYLVVVDAERTLLRQRQSLIQSEGERTRATVDLVRALGGGWEVRGQEVRGS